jgi:2-dehydropantoate 2-reductase
MKVSNNQTLETPMRIMIVGSGAAGGLIGARLVERGADATFVARRERKVQLATQGLQLRSQFGRFRKPVHAIAPDEISTRADLVIVAVRAQDFERALNVCAAAIGPGTTILPVIEGIQHVELAARAVMPRVIVGVLEARLLKDADGVLIQRPPAAELSIGCVRGTGSEIARDIADLLGGRGLVVSHCPSIRAKAWQRFAFTASAVAASTMARRPLRDSFRFAHGFGNFRSLLREAHRIGVAAGYGPDELAVREYEKSVLLEGRPIQSPALISAGGRAGDESTCLLVEMIGAARRARVHAFMFEMAWQAASRSAAATSSSDGMAKSA